MLSWHLQCANAALILAVRTTCQHAHAHQGRRKGRSTNENTSSELLALEKLRASHCYNPPLLVLLLVWAMVPGRRVSSAITCPTPRHGGGATWSSLPPHVHTCIALLWHGVRGAEQCVTLCMDPSLCCFFSPCFIHTVGSCPPGIYKATSTALNFSIWLQTYWSL